MASYIVGSNVCGYLPNTDPIVVDTLKEAKEAVKSIADDYREYGDTVRVFNPLRDITKRALLKNYEVVYAYASYTVAIWIAIESD